MANRRVINTLQEEIGKSFGKLGEYMENKTEHFQAHLLSMLKWFHNKCLDEGYVYYAIGGTALGVRRHKGFIPWDDDIDIGLPRPDYNRLMKDMEGAVGKYVLETPFSAAEDYVFPYSKLYDTTTTLVESTWNPIKRGVYIDVFPIDGVGSSVTEASRCIRSINRKKSLLDLRNLAPRKGRSVLKSAVVVASHAIPLWMLGNHKLAQLLDSECQKQSYNNSVYVGNLLGAYGAKEVIPKCLFGRPVLGQFENIEIYIPEMVDEYLVMIYGDWKRLPPEEKRISHHSYQLLDLDAPFMEREG